MKGSYVNFYSSRSLFHMVLLPPQFWDGRGLRGMKKVTSLGSLYFNIFIVVEQTKTKLNISNQQNIFNRTFKPVKPKLLDQIKLDWTRSNQIEPDRTESANKPKTEKMTEKKVIQRKRDISREFGSRELLEKFVFILFIYSSDKLPVFFIRSHDMFARKSDTIDKQIRVHVEVVRFACFLSEHLISKKTSFTDNFAKSSFFWSFSTLSNSIDITWLTWPKLYKDYLIIKINYYSNIK